MSDTYYKPEHLPQFPQIAAGSPDLAKKFFDYYGAVFAEGALTVREKSLIALAVAHAVQCPYCIDAYTTPQHKARYANDAAGLSVVKGLRNNCKYEIFGDKCFIVAEKNIKPGEEIFVTYTKEYWDCIRYNIKHGLYKTNKF